MECVERAQVHPRIRGEDSGVKALDAEGRGSPPHTRGRFVGRIFLNLLGRFTPAYAGKI